MSKQSRLEALKLAVAVGGEYTVMIKRAGAFSTFIEDGIAPPEPPEEPEELEAAQPHRRQRRKT